MTLKEFAASPVWDRVLHRRQGLRRDLDAIASAEDPHAECLRRLFRWCYDDEDRLRDRVRILWMLGHTDPALRRMILEVVPHG